MTTLLRPALVIFALLTVLTGILYPLAVSGVAQAVFPAQANGSLIVRHGGTFGSSLIGQEFSGDPKYFWGRLSATAPAPFTAFSAKSGSGSSGSNFAPSNPALIDAARARLAALTAAESAVGWTWPDGTRDRRVPVDLVTASGSGLDPHISPAAAEYQAPRVAKARGLAEDEVRALIRRHTQPRQLGVLGEPVVNVLQLNLALDAARP